jgi:hypothetical protein
MRVWLEILAPSKPLSRRLMSVSPRAAKSSIVASLTAAKSVG